MRIVVASNNVGKIKEIKEILNGYDILSLKDVGIDIDIEETGLTFEDNAKLKAETISKLTDSIVLADDSGLSIDALDGFPGVMTHRFLGENASDEDRNNYILDKLKDLPLQDRTAHFITCIAVIKDGKCICVTGDLQGIISKNPRQKNNNGFGFDPIFETANGLTLAEMSSEEKNSISSRKQALKKIKELL